MEVTTLSTVPRYVEDVTLGGWGLNHGSLLTTAYTTDRNTTGLFEPQIGKAKIYFNICLKQFYKQSINT